MNFLYGEDLRFSVVWVVVDGRSLIILVSFSSELITADDCEYPGAEQTNRKTISLKTDFNVSLDKFLISGISRYSFL